MAEPKDFSPTVVDGDDIDFETEWLDDNGAAIPINDAIMQIRPTATSDTLLLALTPGSGLTLDGPNGKVTGNITAVQNAFGLETFAWELKVTSVTGSKETRMFKGNPTVSFGAVQV